MTQQQLTATQPATSSFAPIDPTPIIQSESPTAVILAITILISILVSGITGLVRVVMVTRSRR